jgi:uncharacterized protein YbjQ (UPF0145 family)
MKLLTTGMIDETKYKSLGLVQGLSVRSLSAFRQFFGGFKAFFGQRQGGFEQIFIKSRQEAIQEMSNNANMLGADEVIGINVEVSELSAGGGADGYIVFIAEGTAVAKKDKDLSKYRSRKSRRSRSRKSRKTRSKSRRSRNKSRSKSRKSKGKK